MIKLNALFRNTQFPFIRGRDYPDTWVITDIKLQRMKGADLRLVEEYVSVCRGQTLYFTGDFFSTDIFSRLNHRD